MGQEVFIDYYEILQLSPRADQETIERIYRLLAKRYHPDNRQTGNAERFDELTKAYRVLSNPEKRAGYDAKYEAGNAHQWSVFTHESPSEGGKKTVGFIRRFCRSYITPAGGIRITPGLESSSWKSCWMSRKNIWSFIPGICEKKVGFSGLKTEGGL